MKTCAEISQLLSEAQDRHLSFGENLAARTHLIMCRGCRNYKKQLNFLRDALRSYAGGSRDKKNPDA